MFKNIMNRRISALAHPTRHPLPLRLLSSTSLPTLRPQITSQSQLQCQTRAYHTPYQRFRERFADAKKDIWKTHPILVPSMILFILTTIGTGFYFVYDYLTNVHPRFERYPKPVSDALRKAVYYTEIDLQPTQALAWYKQAMLVAAKVGMHPFSDEVLGIRFQIAAMLERAGMVRAAVEILEKARADCEEWVVNGRRRAVIREREAAVERREKGEGERDEERLRSEREEVEREERESRMRDEVMKKVQGTWLKLAELYGSEYIDDAEKTENALIQAVTVSRGELQRRKDLKLPVSDDHGKGFINLTHVATAYNELADFYVKKGKSNLATTLYMQALSLIKQDQEPGQATCAQVTLLNNISSQMAQQAQLPNLPRPDTVGPPLSHDQLLHAAAEWGKKALEVAAHIKPPIRDEECDQGCLVATYNLGEIAEMQQSYLEAQKLYRTARRLALDLKFDEGVKKADEALKRLKDNQ